MKVKIADTFWASFKKMIDSNNPWRYSYWWHKWYDLKWAIRNLIKYFKIVAEMRPWDSAYILLMMQFQFNILYKHLRNNSIEIEEDLNPKLTKMKRVLELLQHIKDDDFADRCGYIYSSIKTVDAEEGFSELIFDESPEVKDQNTRALKESHELEEKEWDELFELMKDMRRWWE